MFPGGIKPLKRNAKEKSTLITTKQITLTGSGLLKSCLSGPFDQLGNKLEDLIACEVVATVAFKAAKYDNIVAFHEFRRCLSFFTLQDELVAQQKHLLRVEEMQHADWLICLEGIQDGGITINLLRAKLRV